MTVVLGMANIHGLVMAADTEETSDVKTEVQKLMSFRDGCGDWLIVGGAGPDYQVDALTDILRNDFGTRTAKNMALIKQKMKGSVREFYRNHVLNWPSPQEREDNDFSLLIGTCIKSPRQKRHYYSLWVAQKGTLRTDFLPYAVGTGAGYARRLLRHYCGIHPVWLSALIAIHIVQNVKRDVPYCGKGTQVCTAKNGHASHVCIPEVEKAEHLFRKYEDISKKQLFYILGEDESETSSELQVLRQEFTDLIKEF